MRNVRYIELRLFYEITYGKYESRVKEEKLIDGKSIEMGTKLSLTMKAVYYHG